MESLKMIQMKLFTKQTFTDIENKLMAFKEHTGEWW